MMGDMADWHEQMYMEDEMWEPCDLNDPEPREDIATIVTWLVAHWPGLEDGMSWPDNNDHEVITAARRLRREMCL